MCFRSTLARTRNAFLIFVFMPSALEVCHLLSATNCIDQGAGLPGRTRRARIIWATSLTLTSVTFCQISKELQTPCLFHPITESTPGAPPIGVLRVENNLLLGGMI